MRNCMFILRSKQVVTKAVSRNDSNIVYYLQRIEGILALEYGLKIQCSNCHEMYVTNQGWKPITWFLLCRHSTILKHHAWLWMLCVISMVTRIFLRWLYSYVDYCVVRYHSTIHTNPKKIALLDRFFAQFDTQIKVGEALIT